MKWVRVFREPFFSRYDIYMESHFILMCVKAFQRMLIIGGILIILTQANNADNIAHFFFCIYHIELSNFAAKQATFP